MDIEEIKEFVKNKDAWYHVIVPDGTSQDDMVKIKAIFDNSKIQGTFLLTGHDTKIRDITEYMQKHRLKDIDV